jgi:hypothetical protein
MPLIREAIVVTINARGEPHIAPLGLIAEGEGWILAPFHPSTTLDNLRQAPFAVANFTDDVRVFAGCLLSQRRAWRRLCRISNSSSSRCANMSSGLVSYAASRITPRTRPSKASIAHKRR